MTAELIHILQEVRAAVPHIDWQKLYEAAMLEMNPDKLAICIGAAEQAIAQQESSPDVTQLERRKLTDARSMLDIVCRLEPPAAIEVSGEPGITIRWAAGRNNRIQNGMNFCVQGRRD